MEQAKSKTIKSKYKIDDFYQTLPNGKKVLDFKKITDTEFNMFLLMTQRGAVGKTFNSKMNCMDIFKQSNKQSMYIMNTVPLIETAKTDFLKDIRKRKVQEILPKPTRDFWNEVNWTGSNKKNNIWLKHNGQDFIKLLPMNSAETVKGSRSDWGNIIWDEFNVKWTALRKPKELFDSLLHSLEDVVLDSKPDFNFFIFGNSKSMNNPLIWGMGLTHITDEVSEVRTLDGQPIMLVISPQFTEVEREKQREKLKQSFIFNITNQLGTAEHAYFNESLQDDTNNVIRYTTNPEDVKKLIPQFSIYHKEKYYNVYIVNNPNKSKKAKFHIISVEKNKVLNNVLCLSRRQIIENIILKPKMRLNLMLQLSRDNITFEDVVSRVLFIESIQQ